MIPNQSLKSEGGKKTAQINLEVSRETSVFIAEIISCDYETCFLSNN